ncbi:DUF6220 domain-containing protein [Oceanobacillus neutriphilus]|uniref:DoxX-like family protein n=1 Tax=Oceanobacillus neutriphilus TaxID=531815 RepID=A0ABQ2NU85_9BACI|nr:DUF6220 domain-containing protein [Oceanobacillus neutriphilus]GGP10667.1 hypothetical protein GCM10011346_19710 [Oceanobacillus neutriphilus]
MKNICQNLYLGLACLAFLCILIQVYFAGIALFQDYTYWNIHKAFSLFKYIYLAMFIVGLLGKMPKSLTWYALILFAVANLQYYTAHGFLASFHVILPFVIFSLNFIIIRNTLKLVKRK